MDDKPRRFHRLRTLMIAITVVAVACGLGILASENRRLARERDDAVRNLNKSERDYQVLRDKFQRAIHGLDMHDMSKLLDSIDNDKDAGTDGLITFARNWITQAEGWGLSFEPTPEMIAAALLMAANEAGNEHPEYPKALRKAALRILRASIPPAEFNQR